MGAQLSTAPQLRSPKRVPNEWLTPRFLMYTFSYTFSVMYSRASFRAYRLFSILHVSVNLFRPADRQPSQTHSFAPPDPFDFRVR
jgi:hypothetical protein